MVITAWANVASLGIYSRSKLLTGKAIMLRFWISTCSGSQLGSITTIFAASTKFAPLGIASIYNCTINIVPKNELLYVFIKCIYNL